MGRSGMDEAVAVGFPCAVPRLPETPPGVKTG